jgi:hypothetical protein
VVRSRKRRQRERERDPSKTSPRYPLKLEKKMRLEI